MATDLRSGLHNRETRVDLRSISCTVIALHKPWIAMRKKLCNSSSLFFIQLRWVCMVMTHGSDEVVITRLIAVSLFLCHWSLPYIARLTLAKSSYGQPPKCIWSESRHRGSRHNAYGCIWRRRANSESHKHGLQNWAAQTTCLGVDCYRDILDNLALSWPKYIWKTLSSLFWQWQQCIGMMNL